MKRILMLLLVMSMLLVGCSDKPDYSYSGGQQPTQNGQDTVGGGCGLASVENPNILGNPYEAKQEM